ncbi:hypothetical protein [Candidatus Nitrospira inopinata]|nr:hypothetical protein [Candidatus Nitrospira inopinata]
MKLLINEGSIRATREDEGDFEVMNRREIFLQDIRVNDVLRVVG